METPSAPKCLFYLILLLLMGFYVTNNGHLNETKWGLYTFLFYTSHLNVNCIQYDCYI